MEFRDSYKLSYSLWPKQQGYEKQTQLTFHNDQLVANNEARRVVLQMQMN